MVSEQYYQDELNYQKDIDKYNNAKKLGVEITFRKTLEGIEISFPNSFQTENIQGNVSLYRPSNQSLDKNIPFVLSERSTLLIPDHMLVDGRWDIKLSWSQNNKGFLYKKEVVY